jgi:hypothetical protein
MELAQELKNMTPPLPFIVVQNIACKNIRVVKTESGIRITAGEDVISTTDGHAFQKILFLSVSRCRISVNSKLLCISMLDCYRCELTLLEHVVGKLDIIRCESLNVTLCKYLPVVQTDMSTGINFHQRYEEQAYLFDSCMPQNTIEKYSVPESIFRRQLFVLANTSEDELSCNTEMPTLNDIGHMFFQ